jgi:hypothetical protein
MKRVFLTERDKWLVTRAANDSQSYACNGEKWVSFDDTVAIKARVTKIYNWYTIIEPNTRWIL